MADVLEAMGFPSDWCERALKTASGIETAVDLLLQWQAQGFPQFTPPSVGPSSPPNNVLRLGNPGSYRPTLKLQPISVPESKGKCNELEESPSSTLHPSCASSGPSSSADPLGVDKARDVRSPGVSVGTGGVGVAGTSNSSHSRGSLPLKHDIPDGGPTTTRSRCKDSRSGSEGEAGPTRPANSSDTSDAVVPDVFAEERNARYAAAQRAKKEREAEKAKVRLQLQEDMAQRRSKFKMIVPADPSPISTGKQPAVSVAANEPVMDLSLPTQLQIRCPRNQIIKGSFTAGTRLREVRAYVERQLQRMQFSINQLEDSRYRRTNSAPFSGSSSRISTDREAERQLLQTARENFELQTSRILASAKALRHENAASEPNMDQPSGSMYFLIPVPRQEFFTEADMEVTLAEARLVPRGTLIVQYSSTRVVEREITSSAREEDIMEVVYETNEWNEPVSRRQELLDLRHGDAQFKGSSTSTLLSHPFEKEFVRSGSVRDPLDVGGDRARVRELALQAAAKRMSEAARIFREGIPLGEGETRGTFKFPNEEDNSSSYGKGQDHTSQQADQTVLADNILLPTSESAGADAELVDASDRSPWSPSTPKFYVRTLDPLHERAVAAAEARLRSAQCQTTSQTSSDLGPEEFGSRIEVEAMTITPLSRARVPLSSRLLSRPEKQQRMSESPDPRTSYDYVITSPDVKSVSLADAGFEVATSSDTGPDALVEKDAVSKDDPGQMHPCSPQVQEERHIALRVRFEDGTVQNLSFPSSTSMQYVRDAVVPEGGDASEHGFFVNVPEPHFVGGDDLQVSLEEAGLSSREILHLLRISSRGLVRQGRHYHSNHRRRRISVDDEQDNINNHLEQDNLTYEMLTELEDSIGRVHVGVPEEMIVSLPTHVVEEKCNDKATETTEDVDVCIICMSELMPGDEALSLPCVHTYHPLCIRRWLQQSTSCPTCKYAII